MKTRRVKNWAVGPSIVPKLQVLLTVPTNDEQPSTSLYCDKNYEVKAPNQWDLKQGVPFSESNSAP